MINKIKKMYSGNSYSIKIFCFVFMIMVIITVPTYFASPFMDSYCTMTSTYYETFKFYIGGGRLLSACMFLLAGVFHLSLTSLEFISSLLASAFLSLAITKVYTIMSEHIDDKIKKCLILISSIITFVSPFIIELYLFDEVMIMCLGIFLSVLAAESICKNTLKGYLIGLLFIILSVLSYQASICFLIPILILFSLKNISGDFKFDIAKIIKMLFFALLFYGIAFVLDLFVVMISNMLFNNSTDKVGNINLLKNFTHIRTYLLPLTLRTMHNYINPKIFYIITGTMCTVGIIGIIFNGNKFFNGLIFVGIILSAMLMPLVPNLVMNSDLNYFDARQALTFTAIPGLISLYILSFLPLKKYLNYIFAFAIVVCFIIFSYLVFVNLKQDYIRYNKDMKYLNAVSTAIKKYEKKNDIEIKHIYWTKDKNSNDYYDGHYNNLSNLKLTSHGGWAMGCAINAYSNKNIIVSYKEMEKKMSEGLFQDKDYDSFNKKQLYFKDDNLYLLVY